MERDCNLPTSQDNCARIKLQESSRTGYHGQKKVEHYRQTNNILFVANSKSTAKTWVSLIKTRSVTEITLLRAAFFNVDQVSKLIVTEMLRPIRP